MCIVKKYSHKVIKKTSCSFFQSPISSYYISHVRVFLDILLIPFFCLRIKKQHKVDKYFIDLCVSINSLAYKSKEIYKLVSR
jgi:hypothetical protein